MFLNYIGHDYRFIIKFLFDLFSYILFLVFLIFIFYVLILEIGFDFKGFFIELKLNLMNIIFDDFIFLLDFFLGLIRFLIYFYIIILIGFFLFLKIKKILKLKIINFFWIEYNNLPKFFRILSSNLTMIELHFLVFSLFLTIRFVKNNNINYILVGLILLFIWLFTFFLIDFYLWINIKRKDLEEIIENYLNWFFCFFMFFPYVLIIFLYSDMIIEIYKNFNFGLFVFIIYYLICNVFRIWYIFGFGIFLELIKKIKIFDYIFILVYIIIIIIYLTFIFFRMWIIYKNFYFDFLYNCSVDSQHVVGLFIFVFLIISFSSFIISFFKK